MAAVGQGVVRNGRARGHRRRSRPVGWVNRSSTKNSVKRGSRHVCPVAFQSLLKQFDIILVATGFCDGILLLWRMLFPLTLLSSTSAPRGGPPAASGSPPSSSASA